MDFGSSSSCVVGLSDPTSQNPNCIYPAVVMLGIKNEKKSYTIVAKILQLMASWIEKNGWI